MKKLVLIIGAIILTINMLAQSQIIKGNLTLQGDSINTPLGEYGKRLYFGHPSDNSWDAMYIARFNAAPDRSELRVSIGDDSSDKFVVGRKLGGAGLLDPAFTSVLVVQPRNQEMGFVGINQYNPQYPLDVNGTIHAREVKIDNIGWADFVFHKDYKLPSLSEVEAHIKKHSRLPEIPSEAEVKEKGVDVGEMQVKLLQKIEELTLYTIQQQKQLDEQSKLIEAQGKLIEELQKK